MPCCRTNKLINEEVIVKKLIITTTTIILLVIFYGCTILQKENNDLFTYTDSIFAKTTTLSTSSESNNINMAKTGTLIEETKNPDIVPNYSRMCATINNEDKFITSGRIILVDEKNRLIMYDIRSKQRKYFGETKSVAVVVEPTKLAYIDNISNDLKIISNDMECMNEIPAQGKWYGVVDWADEEKVLIEEIQTREDGTMILPSLLILVDYSTEEIDEIPSNYPNMYLYTYGFPRWGKYSKYAIVLNSLLDRLVYLYDEPEGPQLVLWDCIRNTEIHHLYIHDYYYNGGEPIWTDDGVEFVASVPIKYKANTGEEYINIDDDIPYYGGNELVSVTKDGKVDRLTYFTTVDKAEQNNKAWSPDGKIIAFWMKNNINEDKWEIGLLDKETKKVINLCVGGGDGSMPIHWSPDGNNVITSYYDDNNYQNVVIIDINTLTGTTLDIQEYILGWME
jgi:hypothetical protein